MALLGGCDIANELLLAVYEELSKGLRMRPRISVATSGDMDAIVKTSLLRGYQRQLGSSLMGTAATVSAHSKVGAEISSVGRLEAINYHLYQGHHCKTDLF